MRDLTEDEMAPEHLEAQTTPSVQSHQAALSSEMDRLPSTLIRRLNQISVAQFVEAITNAGSDLTPVQYCALTMLREQPQVDQATLAGLIGYDRATTGKVVDRLCAKGLATRVPRPGDRRAKILSLTAEGMALYRRLRPAVEKAQKTTLRGLDPMEQELFLLLLEKATVGANDLSRAPLRRQA